MLSSFYQPLDEARFVATEATAGPWDPRLQHGSPPAALLARAVERARPGDTARLAQLSFQFLGPVPVGELRIETQLLRPGARIELSRARLWAGDRVAMELTAWRASVEPGRAPLVADTRPVPPLPSAQSPKLFGDVPSFGYGESLEWRFADGAFDTPGPATVWARVKRPLVPDEPISPLGRLLLMVDSANGISAELPPSRYLFVPFNLTVDVTRHPRGEWVGMSARTTIDSGGIGLTRAELFDSDGYFGVALQSLFVAPR